MLNLPDHKRLVTRMYGMEVMHSPLAVWVLENVMNALQPTRIIEIGSGRGALTLYLGAWAFHNCAQVLSIDNKRLMDSMTERLLAQLPISLRVADAFDERTIKIAREFLRDAGKALIYCDGGRKPKELAIYSRLLNAGSVIGCHDYGTEVAITVADRLMTRFEPFVSVEQMSDLATYQMFWIRV